MDFKPHSVITTTPVFAPSSESSFVNPYVNIRDQRFSGLLNQRRMKGNVVDQLRNIHCNNFDLIFSLKMSGEASPILTNACSSTI